MNYELQRFLNKTYRLFSVLRFEVRAHWTLPLFAFYILTVYVKAYDWSDGLLLGLSLTLMLYTIILIHELGHSLAARRLRIAEAPILLSPLGGLAGIGGRTRGPREELIVTFWGPVVHPAMLIVGAPLYWLMSRGHLDLGYYLNHMVWQFFWINSVMLLFNLLPAFPMDGGRFLRAFLAMRMHSTKATVIAAYVGQVASIGFIIVAVVYGGEFWFLLIAIGLHNMFVCEQVKIESRYAGPYDETDRSYDLSNYYRDDDDDSLPYERRKEEMKKGPGFLQRWSDNRKQKKEQAEREQERRIRERVDELLDKVSRDGMSSLTREEHDFLNRASETFRKK